MEEEGAVSSRAKHTLNYPNFKRIWNPKAVANAYNEHTNPKVTYNHISARKISRNKNLCEKKSICRQASVY